MIGRQRRAARLAHPVHRKSPAPSASAGSTASSSPSRRYEDLEQSDLDLIVAGTRKAVTMIEGFAREMPEDEMFAAIMFAHEQIVKIVQTDRAAAHGCRTAGEAIARNRPGRANSSRPSRTSTTTSYAKRS